MRRMLKGAALALAVLLAPAGFTSGARAAGEAITLPHVNFSFDGLFGNFDRASAQRGLQVYKEVCSTCHSMRLLSYRNLRDIGLAEADVVRLASSFTVIDGPNDEGAMFERPARPSDRFRRPYPNDNAARAANGGALPPDLSVMTKARAGGAQYINALLIGYRDPPAGMTMADGMYYNAYYPGHQIAMPSILQPDAVSFNDNTPATVEQMARDVSTFLTWAAEPEMEQRKMMGVRIVLFLTILAGLTYAVKRKVWADLKH